MMEKKFKHTKLIWALSVVSTEMVLYGIAVLIIAVPSRIFSMNIPDLAAFLVGSISYLFGLVAHDRVQVYIDDYKKELEKPGEP